MTMTTNRGDNITSDRAALELAITQILEGPNLADRAQLVEMLQERPWIEVARFASYSRQFDTLSLKPWESPPCEITDPDAVIASARAAPHRVASARLLRRMQRTGISRFHPDPVTALREAVEK